MHGVWWSKVMPTNATIRFALVICCWTFRAPPSHWKDFIRNRLAHLPIIGFFLDLVCFRLLKVHWQLTCHLGLPPHKGVIAWRWKSTLHSAFIEIIGIKLLQSWCLWASALRSHDWRASSSVWWMGIKQILARSYREHSCKSPRRQQQYKSAFRAGPRHTMHDVMPCQLLQKCSMFLQHHKPRCWKLARHLLRPYPPNPSNTSPQTLWTLPTPTFTTTPIVWPLPTPHPLPPPASPPSPHPLHVPFVASRMPSDNSTSGMSENLSVCSQGQRWPRGLWELHSPPVHLYSIHVSAWKLWQHFDSVDSKSEGHESLLGWWFSLRCISYASAILWIKGTLPVPHLEPIEKAKRGSPAVVCRLAGTTTRASLVAGPTIPPPDHKLKPYLKIASVPPPPKPLPDVSAVRARKIKRSHWQQVASF